MIIPYFDLLVWSKRMFLDHTFPVPHQKKGFECCPLQDFNLSHLDFQTVMVRARPNNQKSQLISTKKQRKEKERANSMAVASGSDGFH